MDKSIDKSNRIVLADGVFYADYLQLVTGNSLDVLYCYNIQNVSFSYKYFSIFVGRIVAVFSQSDFSGQLRKTNRKRGKLKTE
jgi:hypothetical protein